MCSLKTKLLIMLTRVKAPVPQQKFFYIWILFLLQWRMLIKGEKFKKIVVMLLRMKTLLLMIQN